MKRLGPCCRCAGVQQLLPGLLLLLLSDGLSVGYASQSPLRRVFHVDAAQALFAGGQRGAKGRELEEMGTLVERKVRMAARVSQVEQWTVNCPASLKVLVLHLVLYLVLYGVRSSRDREPVCC